MAKSKRASKRYANLLTAPALRPRSNIWGLKKTAYEYPPTNTNSFFKHYITTLIYHKEILLKPPSAKRTKEFDKSKRRLMELS
jgi:hypothetical protein